jgi:hypothetical protein
MRSRRAALAVVLALALALPGRARADVNYFNPGTMGPNALPPQACETPWIGDAAFVEVGLSVQSAVGPPPPPDVIDPYGTGQPGNDPSATFPFRVEYPFSHIASLAVEGTPAELWFLSRSTQAAWATPDGYGISKGDIRIGAKFLAFAGKGPWPAFAIHAWIKTSTGKSAMDRRFINAPGYRFDGVLGKRLELTRDLALELWASGGFLAWQQAQFGQNDAPGWATTLSAIWATGMALRLQYQGYAGWQHDDKPQAGGLVLELPIRRPVDGLPGVTALLGVTQSFRDPVYTGVTLGVRLGSTPDSLARADTDERPVASR